MIDLFQFANIKGRLFQNTYLAVYDRDNNDFVYDRDNNAFVYVQLYKPKEFICVFPKFLAFVN